MFGPLLRYLIDRKSEKTNMEGAEEHGSGVPPSEAEVGTAERAMRVRQVVKILGGNREAVRKTGVPLSTLGGYLAGGEIKLSNAVGLAHAAGVRLEWLATGQGPMTPSVLGPMQAGDELAGDDTGPPQSLAKPGFGAAEPSPAVEPAGGTGLTWLANPDRLARAYEQALNGFAVPPGRRPDAKRLMQVTLLIYDEMTEAEAASKTSPRPD